MPAALPIEISERIVAAYERGEGTYEQVAQRFRVDVASVNRYIKRSRRGEVSPSAHGSGRAALIGPNDAQTGVASVNRYIKRLRRGEVSPSAHGGGRVALIGPNDAQTLARMASPYPDTSAHDLTDTWKRQRGVQLSVSAIKRAMHRFGLTYKKAFRATEQLRESVQQERKTFKEVVGLLPAVECF